MGSLCYFVWTRTDTAGTKERAEAVMRQYGSGRLVELLGERAYASGSIYKTTDKSALALTFVEHGLDLLNLPVHNEHYSEHFEQASSLTRRE